MLRPTLLWLAVLAPSLALAEPKARPKIALLGVHAESGITQGTANLLSEIISTDVMHTDQYEVLTAADVATLIGVERQKQLLGCNQNDNCFIELGQALGTDLILDASVGTVGTLRVLAIRLYDTKKSRAVARESITVQDESGLVEAAHLATSRVLGVHPPANAKLTPVEPTTETSKPWRPPAGCLVTTGGLVVAVAGFVVGGLALADFNSFKANPYDDALGDRAKTKAYVADALYVTAAVAVAVGIILLVVNR